MVTARKPRYAGELRDAVRAAIVEHPDWTAAQVLDFVKRKAKAARPGQPQYAEQDFPSLKTVERERKAMRAEAGPSEAWSAFDDDPDTAAAVFPVLRYMAEVRPYGRVRPTRDEARRIAVICRAFPDIPPRLAYLAAFFSTRTRPGIREAIEQWLAFTPWRDDGAALQEAVSAGTVPAYVVGIGKGNEDVR